MKLQKYTNDELEKLFRCAICCNLLKQPTTITCGHTFCFDCMYKSLSMMPRCPLCRQYVQTSPQNFKVNTLIFEFFNGQNHVTLKDINKQSLTSINLISLEAYDLLFPFSFLKVQIKKIENSNLTCNDYLENLQFAEVYLTSQSLNVRAHIESVLIQNNNIFLYALVHEKIKITNTSLQTFIIESTDLFGNKEKKDIILPISNGCIIEEDQKLSQQDILEMNEIRHRIKLTTEKIFITKNHHLDSIEQEVYQKLQQCGFFDFLNESDVEHLIKLSFCLPAMLSIKNQKKIEILKQNNLTRLKQAEKELNKLASFRHGGMVFYVPNEHPRPPFLQIILVIIFIIFYFIFIN